LARILRTAVDGAVFHLLIDAATAQQPGGAAEKLLAWLFGRIARLRDRGLLQIETMSVAASRLSNVPAAKPQRSILRAAA
jgi:hypothetical protein